MRPRPYYVGSRAQDGKVYELEVLDAGGPRDAIYTALDTPGVESAVSVAGIPREGRVRWSRTAECSKAR